MHETLRQGSSSGAEITVRPVSEPKAAMDHWSPEIGEVGTAFADDIVPSQSRNAVRSSAISILSKGISPSKNIGRETGLVVGYIQSGKTMSFEMLAALACDNGFQVIIILAGVSNTLLQQSTERIRRDFRIDDVNHIQRWVQITNPSKKNDSFRIRGILERLRAPQSQFGSKRTLLLTVLKQHQRLRGLKQLFVRMEMDGVPVLIIDDEADQASLNTQVGKGHQSTTYRCIMELRQVFPNHTYLQYTATPQAPLLINIIDCLSPNFIEVLEPGSGYVGGSTFFSGNDYVRTIPSSQIQTRSNPLASPPISLLEAMGIFVVGMAAWLRSGERRGNRSMLVHPSVSTPVHKQYINWVKSIIENWKSILHLKDGDSDRDDLMRIFRSSYDDLLTTARGSMPEFSYIMELIPDAVRSINIQELNASAGSTPSVDWLSSEGWILVGGKAMERGFTVEGLTVTYMPRQLGVGNADALQQRARFLGYRSDYLGFCRIYLDRKTLRAFRSYVQHEEFIRDQLVHLQSSGTPLNDWKRAFVLDPALRPCRSQVILSKYLRGNISDQWVSPRFVLAPEEVLTENRNVLGEFVSGIDFEAHEGRADAPAVQQHDVARGVPLGSVLEELLVKMRVTDGRDSVRNSGLLLQLSVMLEESPEESCTVYRMSPSRERRRQVLKTGEINELFQGRDPRGHGYPGDRQLRSIDEVTVQIHSLDLVSDGVILARSVPVIAVWVPKRFSIDWISQS